MVAWVERYEGTDTTATTTATNMWPDTSGFNDCTPIYITAYFEPQENSTLKRQLQLEVSRAWFESFSVPSVLKVLAKGHRGWKSARQTFLLSPARIVSQRYGWQ